MQWALSCIYVDGYTDDAMTSAKVFKSRNSQAVRLIRFQSEEAEILWRGEEVVLREKTKGLERAFWLLANLRSMSTQSKRRAKERPQKRKGL